MITDLDIFIGNHTIIDTDIYKLWISGYTATEAVPILKSQGALKDYDNTETVENLLLSDIMDHYRIYNMLERSLQHPTKLAEQWTFQIDPMTQKMLIEKYFEFDDLAMREVIAKKLTTKHRRDMDDACDRIKIKLVSCKRQYDNARRIYKTVEDMTGPLLQNIQTNFLISEELAKKYKAVVFMTANRFDTNKRKLPNLTFQDIYVCTYAMMDKWTSKDTNMDETDLDREFLICLRDVRVLIDKEKDHKTLVCTKLRGQVPENTFLEVEANFRMYSRTLINIACGLNHSKELRDLFIDLVEKYIEPCKQNQWTSNEIGTFLKVYTTCALELDIMKGKQILHKIWRRYMDVMCCCLIQLYH